MTSPVLPACRALIGSAVSPTVETAVGERTTMSEVEAAIQRSGTRLTDSCSKPLKLAHVSSFAHQTLAEERNSESDANCFEWFLKQTSSKGRCSNGVTGIIQNKPDPVQGARRSSEEENWMFEEDEEMSRAPIQMLLWCSWPSPTEREALLYNNITAHQTWVITAARSARNISNQRCSTCRKVLRASTSRTLIWILTLLLCFEIFSQ